MELKDLLRLMWRNVHYVVIGLVLGLGLGIVVSMVQTPVYEANTKVFISRPRQQSNSDMLSLSDEQLLAINLQLAKSQPVLDDVSSHLGSKIDLEKIQVGTIPNTLIIQIKVQDNDPQRAATIGNLLVQTLIHQNEALLSSEYSALENSISEQIAQIQKQIDGLQAQIKQINDSEIVKQLTQVNQQIDNLNTEISGLEKELAGLPYSLTPFPSVPTPSPLERIPLAQKQTRLDELHTMLNLYQQIQTNLTYLGKPGQGDSNLEDSRLVTLRSTLNLYQLLCQSLINTRQSVRLANTQSNQSVMQIVTAVPPQTPVQPMPVLYVLLGGMVGLCLVVTAVLVKDHLDDSLKTTVQIEKFLNLPVLGFVFDNGPHKNKLVTELDPQSSEADALRALGANLEIIGLGKSIHTLMIVNAGSANDKTTVAANLAVINAQQGKQVILLDGDLKHPHLHTLFGMENQKGFAEIIKGRTSIKSSCHEIRAVKGLTLIPSGSIEKDAPRWLDSVKLTQVLLTLQEHVDLVIVDSPPADIADAQILASKMDAVLLTAREGHTSIATAQTTLSRLQAISVKVAGVIFCRTLRHWKINMRLLTKPGKSNNQVKAIANLTHQ
jgi:capsular exopolysaccharide synthesis family protein